MKDIVAFDVETTGLSPQKDYIIQLVMEKLDPVSLEVKDSRNWYIEPNHTYEISSQAFEKHGLTKDFLKQNGVKLKDIAQDILDFFENCDILTYNGNSFDVNFLYSNLKEIGYLFDISNRIFYDAYLIYKQLHPSTLEAVYKYYTGNELVGAHNAMNDVNATIEVFKHLQKGYKEMNEGLTRTDIDNMDISYIYSPERSITFKTGTTGSDQEKEIVFSNGKHKDEEFIKVCKQDPTYIKWFMENVASDYTKNVLRDYYKQHKQ